VRSVAGDGLRRKSVQVVCVFLEDAAMFGSASWAVSLGQSPRRMLRVLALLVLRISVSPIRTASTPMLSSCATSSRVLIPLSETNKTSLARSRKRRLLVVSTSNVARLRLFTPIMRAPAARARSISVASWASTNAESPKACARCTYSLSSSSLRIEQISNTALAPNTFAS